MHTRLRDAQGDGKNLALYVRFDPTAERQRRRRSRQRRRRTRRPSTTSTGHPVPVSIDTVTATNAANRDYAQPVYAALRADRPFPVVSSGYAGTASDGLIQLDATHSLEPGVRRRAARQRRADRPRRPRAPAADVTLALGLRRDQPGGRRALPAASARADFETTLQRVRGRLVRLRQARSTSRRTRRCRAAQDAALAGTYYLSANVLKASEDKTFPGADRRLAGQPVGPGGERRRPRQHLLRLLPRGLRARPVRDLHRAARRRGDVATAKDTVLFLFNRQQQPDGSIPRNCLVNGKPAPDSLRRPARRGGLPDPHGPHRRAHRSRRSTPRTSRRRPTSWSRTGRRSAPERWEEQSGLLAVDDRRGDRRPRRGRGHRRAERRPRRRARLPRDRRPLPAQHQGVDRHDERAAQRLAVLHPAVQDRRPERRDHLQPRQRRPDRRPARRASTRASSSCRGWASCRRTTPTSSARSASSTRSSAGPRPAGPVSTATGPTRPAPRTATATATPATRPTARVQGKPWAGIVRRAGQNQGSGHLWPVLSGERAEQRAGPRARRPRPSRCWSAMAATASGVGLIPEQAWEDADLARVAVRHRSRSARRSASRTARPPGSASPLTWSEAQFVRLAGDLRAGRIYRAARPTRPTGTSSTRRPAIDADAHRRRPTTRRSTARRRSPGRPRPARQVDVDAVNIDMDGVRARWRPRPRRRTARSRSPSRCRRGPTASTVAATAPAGATGSAQRTVVYDFVPGTLVLDVDRPDGDDNGPGDVRVPDVGRLPRRARTTSQRFQVYDSGTERHLPRADPRPDADLRQPARRPARRRLRHRARRHAPRRPPRRSPAAQLRDRPRVRVEPAHRGPGLRAAVRATPAGTRWGPCRSAPTPSRGSSPSPSARPTSAARRAAGGRSRSC